MYVMFHVVDKSGNKVSGEVKEVWRGLETVRLLIATRTVIFAEVREVGGDTFLLYRNGAYEINKEKEK